MAALRGKKDIPRKIRSESGSDEGDSDFQEALTFAIDDHGRDTSRKGKRPSTAREERRKKARTNDEGTGRSESRPASAPPCISPARDADEGATRGRMILNRVKYWEKKPKVLTTRDAEGSVPKSRKKDVEAETEDKADAVGCEREVAKQSKLNAYFLRTYAEAESTRGRPTQ